MAGLFFVGAFSITIASINPQNKEIYIAAQVHKLKANRVASVST